MKVFLLVFSFLFLCSVSSDCCLADVGEELTKISEVSHSESDHAEETKTCDECQCSTFCSYNLLSAHSDVKIMIPSPLNYLSEPTYKSLKEKTFGHSIFQPPKA